LTGLPEWQNYYVILGSAAGALIGLQFVVMTLLVNMPRKVDMAQAGEAFSTPTIIYFATVLVLAAGLCAPWRSVVPVVAFLGTAGLAGLTYCAIVTRRLLRQTAYEPELEDWLFHAVLPIVSYVALIAAAFESFAQPVASMFCIAAATLLLLLIGIHNAWDSVTYHVFARMHEPENR